MRTKYHVCINVEESIKQPLTLKGCITTENGNVLNTAEDVREFLKGQLALGRKFLPCGDCDNFDYNSGCKGHDAVPLEKAQDVVFNLSRKKLESEKENVKAFSIADFYKERSESLEMIVKELRQTLAKAEHDRDRYKARISKTNDETEKFIEQIKSELRDDALYTKGILSDVIDEVYKRAKSEVQNG